jgi:hypothetical protein
MNSTTPLIIAMFQWKFIIFVSENEREGERRKKITFNNNVACFYAFLLHFPLHFAFFPNCESCVPNGDVATLVVTTHMHFIPQLYIFKNAFFLFIKL